MNSLVSLCLTRTCPFSCYKEQILRLIHRSCVRHKRRKALCAVVYKVEHRCALGVLSSPRVASVETDDDERVSQHTKQLENLKVNDVSVGTDGEVYAIINENTNGTTRESTDGAEDEGVNEGIDGVDIGGTERFE